MKAKTPAERKQLERTRMRERGYGLRQVWVHHKDWKDVQKYLQHINQRRQKLEPKSEP